MIIKKITLKNFRQFKGEQIIEFSQDTEKNITLILGDNTSGKTTLLQAFLWAFYGTANFKSKDSLLNAAVSEEILTRNGNSEVSVRIELEHEGMFYNIVRSQKFSVKDNYVISDPNPSLSLSTKKNGQTIQFKSLHLQNKLEEILPKDLSIYFLYDTERFGNITSKSDVTKSVKSILGLTVLDNLIKHLGSTGRSGTVLNKFSSNISNEGDNRAEIALRKIEEAQSQLEELEKRISQNRKEQLHFQEVIVNTRAILHGLDNVSKLQKEKEDKEKQVEEQKNLLSSSMEDYRAFLKSSTFSFVGHNLCKNAIEELTNAKLDKKSIQGMNAIAIKDIIERRVCVCGTIIEKDSVAHKNLVEEMRFLPPQSIGTLINNFKQQAETHLSYAENYFMSLDSHYKRIVTHNMSIGDLLDEINYINTEISGEDSVKKHQDDLLTAEKKLDSLQENLEDLNRKYGELQKEIKDQIEIREMSIQSSTKNNEILLYLRYAENILTWVKSRRDNREYEIKNQLESKVNYYFKKMYHGKRKVVIDDKFRVNLITTDLSSELHTDESQGLETVKNFAFISGLVDLAKQKLSDSYEKDAEAYPLILDAPFSNADEKHVKNISEVLPNVANQLILIVMAKDWNYAKNSLQSKVGKEYILSKHSEVYTSVTGGDMGV